MCIRDRVNSQFRAHNIIILSDTDFRVCPSVLHTLIFICHLQNYKSFIVLIVLRSFTLTCGSIPDSSNFHLPHLSPASVHSNFQQRFPRSEWHGLHVWLLSKTPCFAVARSFYVLTEFLPLRWCLSVFPIGLCLNFSALSLKSSICEAPLVPAQ